MGGNGPGSEKHFSKVTAERIFKLSTKVRSTKLSREERDEALDPGIVGCLTIPVVSRH